MKKGIIKTFAFALIISLAFGTISFVSAAMVQKGIGYNENILLIEKVSADFHTTLYPTVIQSGPVRVENTVQRKNSSGNYVNISRGYLSVQTTNQALHINYNNPNGKESVRSIWVNQTRNSFVSGDWYLDPDHM